MSDSSTAASRLSFRVQINFILGLGLAILIAVGTLAYRSIDELVDTGRSEGAAFAEVGKLENFIGQIRRVESAQRRFLITGRPEDLEAYRALRRATGFDSGGLPDFNVSPDQQRVLLELERVLTERMTLLEATAQLRSGQSLAAVLARVRTNRSEVLNNRIDELTQRFRDSELRSLRARQADTSFVAGASGFLIFWGIAFALTLLVWAMVMIHRYQARRRAAEDALRAGEAQLRLITDAVPALIGYADREGRLEFHNRPFERLLDRPPERVRGVTLRNLLGNDIYDGIEPHVREVLAGREVQFEFSFPRSGGRTTDLSAQLVPRREGGAVSGYYLLITDVTALKEVDRLKSEFVTTVSHELRTPLTSIRGSLGLLAAGVTGALPEKASQLVKIAVENCERLVRLVTDILDSEKMLSGKMDMKLRPLDLGKLVERTLGANEGYATTHGVTFRRHGGEGIVVQADEDRLTQVVTNLLSNACKFSPRGGEVEVAVEQGAKVGMARVSVSDRGPGVPAGLRTRLFERFAQLDSTDVRRVGGTGLGLSICRGIIERLGGRIDHADRDGGGSTFFFELPVTERQ